MIFKRRFVVKGRVLGVFGLVEEKGGYFYFFKFILWKNIYKILR